MVGLVIYVLVGFIYGVMLDLIGHSWDALKATLPKVSSCVFEFMMLLTSTICWPVMVLFTIVLIVETVVNSVKAKKEADFIVVFVHWGEEYSKDISEEQKEMTELFSKTEADVIIGTHPHVVQKTELIDKEDGGKLLVYYSLGNFRADQGKDKATKTGEEAIFYVAHTYDGVSLKKWETKELNSYWKE